MTVSKPRAAEAALRLEKIQRELARLERCSPRSPVDELKIAWLLRESRLIHKILAESDSEVH